jgi:glycosyltransferase involved in cell wall biosynthesis
MTATGVQRYARELLPHVAQRLGDDLVVIVPPDRIIGASADAVAELLDDDPTHRYHGPGGHWWEQIVLPRLLRRSGARMLWSPCDWGPLAVRGQVPVIHDIAPLTEPHHFERAYRLLARVLTRPLVARSACVATPSARVKAELHDVLGVPLSKVHVVPPGVGEPFSSWPIDDVERRERRSCVLVGAHDARKNAAFLIDIWPQVRARTGLDLVLTRRTVVTTRGPAPVRPIPGVRIVDDPTDHELAQLYADALCLVWPSHYEGYGFPLLEAMAVGTPFLSTDVGASTELAIEPDQVVPLEPAVWVDRLVRWSEDGVGAIARRSVDVARSRTWDAGAAATVALLTQLSSR